MGIAIKNTCLRLDPQSLELIEEIKKIREGLGITKSTKSGVIRDAIVSYHRALRRNKVSCDG